MLAHSTLIRRSVLLVTLAERDAVASAWRHDADAIVLELDTDLSVSRALLPEALAAAARGGAEVFVRIDPRRAVAQLKAAAQPGLHGIVVPDPETAQDIQQVAALLDEREREEGLLPGSLEIFPLLGTARGIWNVREVITASPRIAAVAIDEVRLCRALDIVPSAEFDALRFSRGRVIVEALAALRLPLGLGHPLAALPDIAVDEEELLRVADRARNTGFKGALCPRPGWVAACNRAFTPTEEQVDYYRAVRRAFAEGIARGTAAVPFPGGA